MNSKKGSFALLFVFILICNFSFGQTEKKFVREGNKQYRKGKFNDAEISYRKALEKKKDSFESTFNLGDALYKQGKYDEALEQFKSIEGRSTSKENLSKVQHNIANSLLQTKKYEESIEAYKKSLKLSSKDDEKEQDKKQGDKGDKDDQQKNQPKDKSKISKEDAQRMLDALNNKERQAQKKLGKKEAVRVNIEKDW